MFSRQDPGSDNERTCYVAYKPDAGNKHTGCYLIVKGVGRRTNPERTNIGLLFDVRDSFNAFRRLILAVYNFTQFLLAV